MHSKLLVCVGLAVVAAVAAAALRAAPSDGSVTTVSRWEVSAKVADGAQILTRISNSSTPKHTGAGNITSSWSALWRVRVLITGREVHIVGANGFNVKGTASGEYRGRYPKPGDLTGSYTCPFGPISVKQVLTKLRLQGQGRTDSKVHISIGVNGEPGVLPPLTCTGDLVEPDMPKTLSAGVLTGIESGCFHDPTVAGVKLKQRKTFTIIKKFGWDPPSPAGVSRPCSGFGAPVWSAGFGTIKLVFTPVT